MWKFIIAFMAIVFLAAWDHGAAPSASVVCTFTTGNCTGIGGGSSLFTAATCNGSTDDSPAFASFNSWAVGTWQASHSGQVQLNWPAGGTCTIQGNTVVCNFNANLHCPFINIKNLLVNLNTGTFSLSSGTLISLGGMGLREDNLHSARTVSTSKGDTCVTLVTTAQTSIFTVGQPVMMSGFDLQGTWDSPFGFPPNPQFWDFLTISSINTGTGQICFTGSLSYAYLSTWPLYNAGDASDIDQGGPATLYYLDPSWASTVEFDNGTISSADGYVQAASTNFIFSNVTGCSLPSQNALWKMVNVDMSGCSLLEVDKLIGQMVTTNSKFGVIKFQSSSSHVWTDTNSTISSQTGSPLVSNLTGTTFTTGMEVGAVAYGRSDAYNCTNCVVASLSQGGVSDNGWGGTGVQGTYTMSGGVIKAANGTRYTSVINNSGAAELVVDSSAGWVTGQHISISLGPYANVWAVTVNDPTHMTLNGSTFSGTASGIVCGCSVQWDAPGTNIMFVSNHGVEAIGQVTGVTQDSNFVYIATTGLGSSFPADVVGIQTHPAPIFNCSGCTGAEPQIASLAQAPANSPLFSYQTNTYPGTIGTTIQPSYFLWGTMSQVEANVTAASTGASTFTLAPFAAYQGGTWGVISPTVDAHTSADRKVNSSGVCTGCVGGDSMSSLTAGTWFSGQTGSGTGYSPAPSAGASVTVTVTTNQGVVNP